MRGFEYIKEYRWSDLAEMARNARAVQRKSEASLKGKLAVVTGATSGIGLAVARRFARSGADLVLVCRNRGKAEALAASLSAEAGVRVGAVIADFSDLPAVARAAAELSASYPSMDILVNNAGLFSTRRRLTASGRELVYCVDHLASFLLTLRLLPTLLARPRARIIDVNSQGHRFGGLDPGDLDWSRRRLFYSGLRGYGAAKTAQLLTVRELADRLEGTHVSINALHPGAVRSGIGEDNGPLYRWYSRALVQPRLAEPEVAAEAIHWLAAEPSLEGTSGAYFNLTMPEKPAPQALDRGLGRAILESSLALCGLSSSDLPPYAIQIPHRHKEARDE
jgi:NAD(P)-dependent dehydrogenase (short-subunit alcohol dehydrogenase family)